MKDLPIEDVKIKLNSLGIKANTNLYQMKMAFTGDVESEVINVAEGASLDPKMVPIDSKKTIAAAEVYIRENEEGNSNIYGIRLLDEGYMQMHVQIWRRSNKAKWVRIGIPDGMQVIGFHGTHDQNYIKQFGLVLWKPNPYV